MKGLIFYLDATLALVLMIAVVAGIGVYYTIEPELEYRTIQAEAEDLMQLMSQKMNATEFGLPDNYTNKTFLEAVGTLWVEGNQSKAREVVNDTLGNFERRCLELSFEGDVIYNRTGCDEEGHNVAVSNRVASGYASEKKPEGYMARVILNKLKRVVSEYVYFGGYVGDGNITKNMTLMFIENAMDARMELDAGSEFELYINGAPSGTYSPSQANMTSDVFVICNQTYQTAYCDNFGENTTLEFRFLGNRSYIGGGNLRVRYNTTEFEVEEEPDRHELPGIDGIINLYSSFYVPGAIQEMETFLHYRSNFTIFFNIGNVTLYNGSTNEGEDINVTISNTVMESLLNSGGLNYTELSKKTVPVRLGMQNVSYLTLGQEEADVFSVTDISGSMGEDYGGCDVPYDCGDPRVCGYGSYECQNYTVPDCDQAYCHGSDCSQWCCNSGPFWGTCCDEDQASCIACGGTWSCGWLGCSCSGGSCTSYQDCCDSDCCNASQSDCQYCEGSWITQDMCDNPESYCGSTQSLCQDWCNGTWAPSECYIERIDLAKDANNIFIDTVLNYSENRVGLVAYETGVDSGDCHDLSTDNVSLKSKVSEWEAEGSTCICCGINGAVSRLLAQSGEDKFKSMVVMSDGEANVGCGGDPKEDAVHAACDAWNDHEIKVYAIGFGQGVDNVTLMNISDCGHGEYYYADVDDLVDIYRLVAKEIINASYEAQTVEVYGGDYGNITLYPDSYIGFNYTPETGQPEYGEISITVESSRFGGSPESPKNGSFMVPDGTRALDAKVTSYSSEYWTDRALIYNGSWKHVYRLWDYGEDYQELGDPYAIYIPLEYVGSGENEVSIDTGATRENTTGGSPDSRVIYTLAVEILTNYTGVFNKSEGSAKQVYYDLNLDKEDEGYVEIPLGNDSDPWDPELDAVDNALLTLLDRLNFYNDTGTDDGDQDNPIDVYPGELSFDMIPIGGVPWLWGPGIFTLKVW